MIPKSLAVLFAGAALAAGACGGGGGTESKGAPLCAVDPGPAPLRRITRFEYGRTVADLTGAPATVADQLPPDEETLGFDDIASAYSVSSLHAARYMGAAEEAAKVLTADGTRLTAFGGCNPTAGDDACVSAFITGFGKRAWRRPLDADELQAMRAVVHGHRRAGPGRRGVRGDCHHVAVAAVHLPSGAADRRHRARAARRLRARHAALLSADRRGARRFAAGGRRSR